LVSEKAAEEIDQRRTRKANGFEQIRPEDEPLNIVTITRTTEGFLITKSYLTEEQHLVTEGMGLRRDSVVKEQALLVKEKDHFSFKMQVKEAQVHLHTLGKTWVPQDPSEEAGFKEVPVTPKDLVRTLVLLVEGL